MSSTVTHRCTCCGKPTDEVGQLVTGMSANICAGCVAVANEQYKKQQQPQCLTAQTCSFCHKRRKNQVLSVASDSAEMALCKDCLDLCNQIVSDHAPPTTAAWRQSKPKEPTLTRKKKPET